MSKTPPAQYRRGETVIYCGKPATIEEVGRERVNPRTYLVDYVMDVRVGTTIVRNAGRNQRWVSEVDLAAAASDDGQEG